MQELVSDPSGICFAFGGVDPGTLHAHGQLHDVHRAHYSVGRVGKYLLHISLRSQALPLPGSPFTLNVVPGQAHAGSTVMPPEASRLTGLVGISPDDGCKLRVIASDKMGNVCTAGGASVTCSCTSSDVVCNTTDKNDGSYLLEWRSKFSGVFEVHVFVDKHNIQGSPMKLRLASTNPDLNKTVISGAGVDGTIAAGMAVQVNLSFRDEYSNWCRPGSESSYKFGMALLPERSGEKPTTAAAHPSEGEWGTGETGEYTLTYTATTAGNHELYLWCETSKGDRQILPGSPFSMHVQSGKASSDVSEVDGFITESAEQAATKVKKDNGRGQGSGDKGAAEVPAVPDGVTAGESVIIRPSLRDDFGNPAHVPEGALTVLLSDCEERSYEDKVEMPMMVSPIVRGGLTSYECRYETSKSGVSFLHVRLHGVPVKGSPVRFRVSPALHDRDLTKVEGPQSPGLYVDETYKCIVRLRDRFGNFLEKGGAAIAARLVYIKQGMHDSNLLNSQNHIVNVEDKSDGTYHVTFGLMQRGLSNWPLSAHLIINADKDAKDHPNGIDVNTELYHFHLSEEQQNSRVERAGRSRSSTSGLAKQATKGNLAVAAQGSIGSVSVGSVESA